MHKLTAALLAAFGAARRVASNIASRFHAVLLDLHVSNLRALVARAEVRIGRFEGLVQYHKAAAAEADTLADEAARVAGNVAAAAEAEAAKHGASLA
jgi:hypothetical protein